jgi:hypothetical protein
MLLSRQRRGRLETGNDVAVLRVSLEVSAHCELQRRVAVRR